jgi:hypothetical protein
MNVHTREQGIRVHSLANLGGLVAHPTAASASLHCRKQS